MLEFLLVIYGVKSASLNKATAKYIRSTYKARSLSMTEALDLIKEFPNAVSLKSSNNNNKKTTLYLGLVKC